MNRILETLARWRTWIFNLLMAAFFLLPELLRAPEVLAVLPDEYRKWAPLAALIIVNLWMRPRPAVLPSDPEVKAKQAPEFQGENV